MRATKHIKHDNYDIFVGFGVGKKARFCVGQMGGGFMLDSAKFAESRRFKVIFVAFTPLTTKSVIKIICHKRSNFLSANAINIAPTAKTAIKFRISRVLFLGGF